MKIQLCSGEDTDTHLEEKMNLYPIAQSEIYKNGNLTQNDGWE